MPGRRGPPTPAMPGREPEPPQRASRRSRPAPGCTTMPAGLSTTSTSSSSYTIDEGDRLRRERLAAEGGTSISTRSPPRSRCAALRTSPSTRTRPPRISAWSRARERSVRRTLSQRSSLTPADAGSTVSTVTAQRARGGRPVDHETEGEERDADRDRGVGHVEGRPVPAAQVDVHEVDDRAEAHAIDQVSDRAAEDEPDRRLLAPAAAREDAQGHARRGRPAPRGRARPPPSASRRDAAEEPEREPRIHDERQREEAIDHAGPGRRGSSWSSTISLGDLIERRRRPRDGHERAIRDRSPRIAGTAQPRDDRDAALAERRVLAALADVLAPRPAALALLARAPGRRRSRGRGSPGSRSDARRPTPAARAPHATR